MIDTMNVLRQHSTQMANGKRSSAQLAGWQRIGLLAYVLFLGLVLPLICWGNVADPTHPHKGPHLVFSMPPGEMVKEAATVEQTAHHHHHHHHHAPTKEATAQPPPNQEQPTRPVGQSRPTLLLMVLLGIVTALLFFVQPSGAPTHWRRIGISIVTAPTLPVPVPPPRLLSSH
jgi:hypothetical protein